MFKRATWLSVGLVAGFGASKWLERKARRRLARYLPAAQLEAGREAVVRARETAAGKLAGTVSDLRHAVEGGRDAMAEREADLRRQLRLSPGPAAHDHLPPVRPLTRPGQEGRSRRGRATVRGLPTSPGA